MSPELGREIGIILTSTYLRFFQFYRFWAFLVPGDGGATDSTIASMDVGNLGVERDGLGTARPTI